jgi:hypothetical protein
VAVIISNIAFLVDRINRGTALVSSGVRFLLASTVALPVLYVSMSIREANSPFGEANLVTTTLLTTVMSLVN